MPNENPVIKILEEQTFIKSTIKDSNWYEDNTDSVPELVKEIEKYHILKYAFDSLQYVLEKKLYAVASQIENFKVIPQDEKASYSTVKETIHRKHRDAQPLIAALIAPFQNKKTDKAFKEMLLKNNKTGDTLLHSFYRHYDHSQSSVIEPLLHRISKLDFADQKEILLAKDHQGKNFYHIAIENLRKIDNTTVLFPEPILFALFAQDNALKTPLHHAYKTAQIDFVTKTWQEKKSSINQVMQKFMLQAVSLPDKDGKNVLHQAFLHDKKTALNLMKKTLVLLFNRNNDSQQLENARQVFFKCLLAKDKKWHHSFNFDFSKAK